MVSHLQYLTVQDILWINLQVTEKVHSYSFAKLEEATYYQYAYGESSHIYSQAGRFVLGFPKMSPLQAGNDATNFIAALAFLKMNGLKISLTDASGADWYRAVLAREINAVEALKSVAKPVVGHGHSHAVDIRRTVRDLISEFPATLAALG